MAQLALPSGERDLDGSVTVYGVVALGVAALVTVGALAGAWLTMRYGTRPFPAKGFIIQDYYGNVLLVTMLMAFGAGWWGLYGTAKDDRRQAAIGFGLFIFLQAAFINLITYVLRQAKLSPASNSFGVIYYAINGTMIVMSVIGILVGAVALARVLGGQVTSREPSVAWAAAWYASIVMAAWAVVYVTTYVLV